MTRALNRCDFLADRLEKLQGTTLKLHSLFETSVNFMAQDGHIVTFLAARTPMAVCSVRLPAVSLRDFFGNETDLLVQGTHLQGQTVEIELAGAASFDPRLRENPSPRQTAELIALIRTALLERIPERGIYQEIANCPQLDIPVFAAPPSGGKYARRFEAFVDGLFAEGWPEALRETVRSMIGYGIGLTPAADDFLNGVLAACSHREACFGPLAAACRANLSRTTTISAEMLYHGSEGRFSQSILALLEGSDPNQAIDDLLGHGHSSGHDTLCGIYAGLMARQAPGQT